MVDVGFVALAVSFPLLVMTVCAIFAYLDAPDQGMDPLKWAVICFCIPLFGFFAYILERAERNRTPEDEAADEMFVDGPFRIHESRADDTPAVTSKAPGPDELDEHVDGGSDETRDSDEGKKRPTESDPWE